MILQKAVYKWKHQESYKKQSSIHWFIWLLENPSSPISLTGAIEFCARWIYPTGYRFNSGDLAEYRRGYEYGYSRPKKNIHLEQFDITENISAIRKKWGINLINI